jgi:hypothetical protein
VLILVLPHDLCTFPFVSRLNGAPRTFFGAIARIVLRHHNLNSILFSLCINSFIAIKNINMSHHRTYDETYREQGRTAYSEQEPASKFAQSLNQKTEIKERRALASSTEGNEFHFPK